MYRYPKELLPHRNECIGIQKNYCHTGNDTIATQNDVCIQKNYCHTGMNRYPKELFATQE